MVSARTMSALLASIAEAVSASRKKSEKRIVIRAKGTLRSPSTAALSISPLKSIRELVAARESPGSHAHRGAEKAVRSVRMDWAHRSTPARALLQVLRSLFEIPMLVLSKLNRRVIYCYH